MYYKLKYIDCKMKPVKVFVSKLWRQQYFIIYDKKILNKP